MSAPSPAPQSAEKRADSPGRTQAPRPPIGAGQSIEQGLRGEGFDAASSRLGFFDWFAPGGPADAKTRPEGNPPNGAAKRDKGEPATLATPS